MTTFAPPARRGDFLYSSVLYADPGNNNQHPRASVAELAALLRPEAPSLYSKGCKPDFTLPAKDPPWHYYGAQLIHYGLPVTKDKNTAKIRLLNALNQFKLEVPAWILKLESDLKKEWEADNKKLRKGQGSTKTVKTVKGDKQLGKSASKATATDSNGVNVTVNLSLTNGFSIIEQTAAATAKQLKPSTGKRSHSETTTPPVSGSKKAAKTKKESSPQKPVGRRLVPTPSRSLVKNEYQSGSARFNSRTPSPHIKRVPYADTYDEPDRILLSGHYEITCPIASNIFDEYNLDMTLSLDPARTVWWATFRWGAWDGLIQMSPGPSYDPFGQCCSLKYRLRNLETGQLSFSNRCTGTMKFFEDRTLRACLFDFPEIGLVEFEGSRMPGPGVENDLQDEWESFVKQAYRRR